MPTISDVSIINWNTTEAKPVPSGLERTICSEGLCGSKTLTVYQRTVVEGRQFDVNAHDDYHLVYVVEAPNEGIITCNGKSHAAEEGAGVLLAPGESARFEASGSKLELLHMVTPKPPAAVEGGLPGGPGYFFNRRTLCAASAPSPPLDFSMAPGSRQPMPFKRARCTITKADRHPIIGTSAPAPTPVAHPTATSRSRAVAWSKSVIRPRNYNQARSSISPLAYRIGFVPTAVLSITSSSRLGGVSRLTCSARNRWDSSGTTTPRHPVPRGWSGTRADKNPKFPGNLFDFVRGYTSPRGSGRGIFASGWSKSGEGARLEPGCANMPHQPAITCFQWLRWR
jgi:hypothetical protein